MSQGKLISYQTHDRVSKQVIQKGRIGKILRSLIVEQGNDAANSHKEGGLNSMRKDFLNPSLKLISRVFSVDRNRLWKI